jgi:hypothetical protein
MSSDVSKNMHVSWMMLCYHTWIIRERKSYGSSIKMRPGVINIFLTTANLKSTTLNLSNNRNLYISLVSSQVFYSYEK